MLRSPLSLTEESTFLLPPNPTRQAWRKCMRPSFPFYSPVWTAYSLDTLGDDGKWPDSQVDYRSGCHAQRANWPAGQHWFNIGTLKKKLPLCEGSLTLQFCSSVTIATAWSGKWERAPKHVIGNPDVREKIGRAMDWWFANDYSNSDCLDSGGTDLCPCGTPGMSPTPRI